jgi:hypothetical protein
MYFSNENNPAAKVVGRVKIVQGGPILYGDADWSIFEKMS